MTALLNDANPGSRGEAGYLLAVKGYERLTVEEVLADLPELDLPQLRFIRAMEEAHGGRAVVLAKISERLEALGERIDFAVDIRPVESQVRRDPRGVKMIAAFVALVVAAGGALAVLSNPGRTPAPAVDRPASTATSTQPIDPAMNRLTGLTVAVVPAGYTQEPDPVGSAPSELSSAVADDGMPGAQSVLSSAGFVHGVKRAWRTGDQHQLTATVFQFKDPAAATAYTKRRVDATRSDPQATVTGFAAAGIPGATGLTDAVRNSVTSSVYFSKGGYFVQLSANWYSAAGLEGTALTVARDQYRIL